MKYTRKYLSTERLLTHEYIYILRCTRVLDTNILLKIYKLYNYIVYPSYHVFLLLEKKKINNGPAFDIQPL